MNIIVVITGILAYIVGAIPTGYIVARLKGIRDIREHGSGNIGATNVSRVLGLFYFFLIFILDAGKAFLFMYAIKPYFPKDYLYVFGILCLIGNGCSVFLRGTGGKGVATLCGLLGVLGPVGLVIILVAWSIVLLLTKTVGIASVCAGFALPVYAYHTENGWFFVLFACYCAIWICWTHRQNIFNYWQKRSVK